MVAKGYKRPSIQTLHNLQQHTSSLLQSGSGIVKYFKKSGR